MELSGTEIKKFLIFSHRKPFLIFRERKLFKKTSYILGGNFPSLQNKKIPTVEKFLIFWETKLF